MVEGNGKEKTAYYWLGGQAYNQIQGTSEVTMKMKPKNEKPVMWTLKKKEKKGKIPVTENIQVRNPEWERTRRLDKRKDSWSLMNSERVNGIR